ncbi:MAG: hypothetical protein H7288_05065 [Kineosporiaceae bacterium]|nr:hypothetical protein [Aeromicrobium sp.]
MTYQSKKSLRKELATYREMWEQAERENTRYCDQAVKAGARLKLTEWSLRAVKQSHRPPTYVLAGSLRRADDALFFLGLRGAPCVKVITTVEDARWVRIENGDRVIKIQGWDRDPDLVDAWGHVMGLSRQAWPYIWHCETV